MSEREHDWPLELAGAHGRISAYRAVLRIAEDAIMSATPYVNNVKTDPANAPWRRETAEETFEKLRDARDRIARELAVHTKNGEYVD